MAFDGLEDAYDGKPMGFFADKTAEKYGFTREQMDAYAKESTERALRRREVRRLRRRDRAGHGRGTRAARRS